ncbi:hypothetical protein Emag_007111 [Eimeria magna]
MPETRLEPSELSLQHQARLALQPPAVEQQISGGGKGMMSVTQQQPLQQHDQHYATLVAALKEALQSVRAESSTSNDQCSNARLAGFTESLMRPPPFRGQRPREWLTKLKRYHSLVGIPESMRVDDACNYLEGAAFTHFCSARTSGKAPVTWKDFETFMLDRFSCQNAGETIRRLRNLRWDGSLERLAARFDAVLARGDTPPEPELVRIFLSRLPFCLVRLVCRQHFDTWIAAKEALREALDSEERARQLWLVDAPPELVREEDATISFRQQPRSHRQEYQPHHTVSGGNPAKERVLKAPFRPRHKFRNNQHRTADSSNASMNANSSESNWQNRRSEQENTSAHTTPAEVGKQQGLGSLRGVILSQKDLDVRYT